MRLPACPRQSSGDSIVRSQPGILRLARALLATGALAASMAPVALAGELQIARTVMADAAPSSFAIGFPNGNSFCWDPVRGGLSYAWSGGFADLTPTWPEVGKFVKPAKLLGEVRYRETGSAPLRRGDPLRRPEIAFKGYRLDDAAIEFRYTIDGVLVREQVTSPDRKRIVRRFQIEAGDSDSRWWYVPGTIDGAPLVSPRGERDGAGYRFDPNGSRDFTLVIQLGEGAR